MDDKKSLLKIMCDMICRCCWFEYERLRMCDMICRCCWFEYERLRVIFKFTPKTHYKIKGSSINEIFLGN